MRGQSRHREGRQTVHRRSEHLHDRRQQRRVDVVEDCDRRVVQQRSRDSNSKNSGKNCGPIYVSFFFVVIKKL